MAAQHVWRPAFIEQLGKTGNVTLAAEHVGVSRAGVYKARLKSQTFATDWDEALERATDLLEGEARRRAAVGVERAIYHKGEVVGHERVYSDNLLMFLIKGNRPEKFRDNMRIEHDGKVKHDGEVTLKGKLDLSNLSMEDLANLAQLGEKLKGTDEQTD